MSLNSTGTLVTQVASATGADVNTTIGGANVRHHRPRAAARSGRSRISTTTRPAGTTRTRAWTAFDKRNIRDGHYPIWGAIHIYTRVDEAGIPINAGANRFINLTLGTDEIEGLDPIALEATSNLIPQCAMTVARTEDGGPLSSSLPPRPCGMLLRVAHGRHRLRGVHVVRRVPRRGARVQLRLLRALSRQAGVALFLSAALCGDGHALRVELDVDREQLEVLRGERRA
jgi:hypothetical protein